MIDKSDPGSMTTRQLRARRGPLARSLPVVEGLIAGSGVEQARRCGKEGCRCATGQAHGPYTYVVLPRSGGRARTVYIPASAAEAVRRGAATSTQVRAALAQVRDNTESTARQYGLVEEAVRLGWARSAVEVIDADLGLSGRSAEHRSGYKDLVGRVCLGEVGAIFGLEVSRLARSSADLSRLLELARLTDTLVVDADGIYDLANFNDRLLLGLKGTMSEAELHLLAGRLQGAKRAAAARGELRTPLPVGYLHDDQGATVIDPDEQVRAAVADVFTAFTATGSAYQVVAAFTGRRFPLRAYGGAWAGQLRWDRLNHARVLGIVNNPCYAGAYVFGRYAARRTVAPDGSVHSGITRKAMAD